MIFALLIDFPKNGERMTHERDTNDQSDVADDGEVEVNGLIRLFSKQISRILVNDLAVALEASTLLHEILLIAKRIDKIHS
jgi:hypothetical protein